MTTIKSIRMAPVLPACGLPPLLRRTLAVACLGAVCSGASHAAAAAPSPGCARADTRTDDRLRPLPPAWIEPVQAALGLGAVPPDVVRRGTVWRCEEGRVMACFVGGNLPCGKLDRRAVVPAVARWCRGRPDAPVPASVSGHATAWRWACAGGRAVQSGVAWQVDGRGFAREIWRPLQIGPR